MKLFELPRKTIWATTSIPDEMIIHNTERPNLSITYPKAGAAIMETKLGMEMKRVAVFSENLAPVCCIMSLNIKD